MWVLELVGLFWPVEFTLSLLARMWVLPLVCHVCCLLTSLWLYSPVCECCPSFITFTTCWPFLLCLYSSGYECLPMFILFAAWSPPCLYLPSCECCLYSVCCLLTSCSLCSPGCEYCHLLVLFLSTNLSLNLSLLASLWVLPSSILFTIFLTSCSCSVCDHQFVSAAPHSSNMLPVDLSPCLPGGECCPSFISFAFWSLFYCFCSSACECCSFISCVCCLVTSLVFCLCLSGGEYCLSFILLAVCWSFTHTLSLPASLWVLSLIHSVCCLSTSLSSCLSLPACECWPWFILFVACWPLVLFPSPGCECCPLFILFAACWTFYCCLWSSVCECYLLFITFAVCWPPFHSVSGHQYVSAALYSSHLLPLTSAHQDVSATHYWSCLLLANLSLALSLLTSLWVLLSSILFATCWSLSLALSVLISLWVLPIHPVILFAACWPLSCSILAHQEVHLIHPAILFAACWPLFCCLCSSGCECCPSLVPFSVC